MAPRAFIPVPKDEVQLLSYKPTIKGKIKLLQLSLSRVRDIYEKHGIDDNADDLQMHNSEEDEKDSLAQSLAQYYEREHPYTSYIVPVLRQFVKQRDIVLPRSAGRFDLIQALETADKKDFPFMKLPPEIREFVYRYAFLQTHKFRSQSTKWHEVFDEQPRHHQGSRCYGDGRGRYEEPALTRVSHPGP